MHIKLYKTNDSCCQQVSILSHLQIPRLAHVSRVRHVIYGNNWENELFVSALLKINVAYPLYSAELLIYIFFNNSHCAQGSFTSTGSSEQCEKADLCLTPLPDLFILPLPHVKANYGLELRRIRFFSLAPSVRIFYQHCVQKGAWLHHKKIHFVINRSNPNSYFVSIPLERKANKLLMLFCLLWTIVKEQDTLTPEDLGIWRF